MTPKSGKPLLEYYVKRYEEVEGRRPILNRNKKVWGFADMVADLGAKDAQEVVEFYFTSYGVGYHDVDTLLAKYDTMYEEMLSARSDAVRRSKIARETAERVKRLSE